MKLWNSVRFPAVLALAVAIAVVMVPNSAKAQVTYNVNAGAETKDQSVQADGFFPNEVWLLEGDSIKWTFAPKNEPHTVTFLSQNATPEQVRPPFGPPACPPPPSGTQPSGSSFTGASCVTSGPLAGGATYTVTFPKAGNFKLVCLIHTDMNGTVHVLVNNAKNAAMLHSQRYYTDKGQDESADILQDRDHQGEEVAELPDNQVLAGIGEIVATGGGTSYRAGVRFLRGTIYVHVGESVEWVNLDPTEPHTVTFGTEPASFTNPMAQVDLGTPEADGTLTGTINSTSDFLNSGFIAAQAPDRPLAPQLPPGTTRIRITFTHPGTYNYHCALHDIDGMVGKVIVEK